MAYKIAAPEAGYVFDNRRRTYSATFSPRELVSLLSALEQWAHHVDPRKLESAGGHLSSLNAGIGKLRAALRHAETAEKAKPKRPYRGLSTL